MLADGRTRLTEDWASFGGQQMFRDKYGAEADSPVELRRKQAPDGIPVTLAPIKRLVGAEIVSAPGR